MMSGLLEAYTPGRSAFHRMEPRLKIAALGLVAVAVALLTRPLAAATALVLTLGAALWAGFSPRYLARRLAAPACFLALFFAALPPAHPAGWTAGMRQALVITLKGLALILLVFPMFGTAPVHRSLRAMERMGLSSKLADLFLLTYRYIAVYRRDLDHLGVSMRARGFRPRPRNLATLGRLVGSLLVRALEQTERIHTAMRCRGGDRGRGLIPAMARPAAWDWGAAALAAAAALALLLLDRAG